jgi:hypothetical protein
MGNNGSILVDKITCQICGKILSEPILIPCKCSSSICKQHLNEIFENEDFSLKEETLFECKNCKTNLRLVKSDLKENAELKLALKDHVYKSPSKKKLIFNLKAKLDEIEKYLLDIKEKKLQEYSLQIYDHFYALKNEIDVKRETVLEKHNAEFSEDKVAEIHRLSVKLIEQIDLAESQFRKNFIDEITSLLDEVNLEKHKQQLEEKTRNISIKKREIVEINNDYETLLRQAKSKFTRICLKFETNKKINKFREYLEYSASENGKLTFF